MTHPLVCTPAIRPKESLLGYVLRLSEANGYERPGWFLTKTGRGHHVIRAVLNPEVLARQLGLSDTSALVPLGYADDAGNPVLLGRPIGLGHLRLYAPKFCPLCVAERGHIEALWDCVAVTACPRHRTPLAARCPRCRNRITWDRPGLLTCPCGADLHTVPSTTWSTEACAELSGYVAAALGYSGSPLRSELGFPTHLAEMPLYDLLWFIRTLGRRYQLARGNRRRTTFGAIVESAAAALADWPGSLASPKMQRLRSSRTPSVAQRHRITYLHCRVDPVDQFLKQASGAARTSLAT